VHTLLQVIGVAVLLVLAGVAIRLIVRAARANDVLAPVLWGGGLRFGVMVAAHVVSSLAGDGGFQYLDDSGYSNVGELLAGQWLAGSPPRALEPAGVLLHGGPVFYHLAGLLTLITGSSVIPLKLLNVLLSTATVLFAALLADRVLGRWAVRRTAWIVALAPTIIWWSAPMLKEPLVAAVFIATLAVAASPLSARNVAGTAALLTLLSLTRFPIFIAAASSIVLYRAVVAFSESRLRGRIAVGPATAAAVVAVLSAGLALWIASTSTGSVAQAGETIGSTVDLGRAENRVDPRAGETIEPTVDPGRAENRVDPRAGETIEPTVDPGRTENPVDPSLGTFDSNVATELSGNRVTAAAAAFSRFTLSPRAWAFVDQPFDWYQPLYPPMWLWYAVLPVAALGLWRLRTRPEAILIVGPVVVAATIYSVTLASGVRQRSAIEPLLVLLVVAGFHSRRALGLSAAGALTVVAPLAALDLGSVPAGLAILAVAGGIALVTLKGWYPGAADDRAGAMPGTASHQPAGL
jgi:hypothetical protein